MAADNYASVLTSRTPNLFCLLYSRFPRPSAQNRAYQYPGGLLTDCRSVRFVLLFGVDTLTYNDGRCLLTCASHVGVIVMTFWYVLLERTYIFRTF